MSNFDEFLNKQLENPQIKAEYDALDPEFTAIQAIITERKKAGLTQREPAHRSGITQTDNQ